MTYYVRSYNELLVFRLVVFLQNTLRNKEALI